MKIEDKYIWRALQLARNGEGRVSPNPMVGAVIVNGDRIIGEGYHAYYGGPHAEVNAINSVKTKDRHLLKDSTIYVTLEPCAHYGKTPPCANLIVDSGIPRVVIGSNDPNPKVSGKGVEILKTAGIEVETGVLENECDSLNKRFMKAHTGEIPWIILKWAQSSDGYMASCENGCVTPFKFSSSLSSVWMHRQRANVDAIIVGANTERIDHPGLNVRYWGGNSPKKYVAEGNLNLSDFLKKIRKEGITSIMVEGGAHLLSSFIQEGLYDEIRVEISPVALKNGLKVPFLPDDIRLIREEKCRDNIILNYRRF